MFCSITAYFLLNIYFLYVTKDELNNPFIITSIFLIGGMYLSQNISGLYDITTEAMEFCLLIDDELFKGRWYIYIIGTD